MNYVYDITVNWKNKYVDFFEWRHNDKIVHISKISVFKVRESDFKKFIISDVSVDSSFLNKIKGKKEYVCLFMSDDHILAMKFNSKGESILKSSLIVDEELDILENYYHIELTNINYQVKQVYEEDFTTLKEQQMINYLSTSIDNLDTIKDDQKIKYLYFECFGLIEKNSKVALSHLKKDCFNCSNLNKLYRFFKLIDQK